MSVHQQLDTLTEQASTGLVSQTYAGLGGGEAGVSLDLNPQINTLQAYQNNINQATGSMQVTQTAMTQIQQIASTFADDIPNLSGVDSSEVDSIAAQANAALQQVATLLNTQDGTDYVFAGQDTSNPPVPSGNGILSPRASTPRHQQRGHQRSVEQRARCYDRRKYPGDRQFQRDRHLAVLGLPVAAGHFHQRPGGADRRGRHRADRIAGQRELGRSFVRRNHHTPHQHRVLHARPDDDPGDAGIAVQFPDRAIRVSARSCRASAPA